VPIPIAAESASAARRRRVRRPGNERHKVTAPDFDPLEDLCRIAEAYRKERGLSADEAIQQILSEIRSKG